MTITLYYFPASCSRVTMTALEEIGVPFEEICVNIRKAAHQQPQYLSVNRKGKIPAIAFDGQVMTENAAILWCLHSLYPEAKLLPTAVDTVTAHQPLSDLVWCSSTIHPIVRQIRMPMKLTTGDTAGIREDGMNKLSDECAYLADRIGQHWWYGDQWSIIDTYLYWAYSTARKSKFPLENFPALIAHAERVRARPSFQRVLAREQAAVDREAIPDVEL